MEKNSPGLDAEVSLRIDRLLYAVIRNWRKLLKAALWAALLFAVAISLLQAIGYCSPENREKTEAEYEIALFSHETRGETLQNDIQNLYASLSRQKTYNANSLLMQINPYNKYEAVVTYYVDTDYYIMPQYQYQNIDYGPRLVQMYAEYMNDGEMFGEIVQALSGISDTCYVEELCEVSAYHSMGMVELRVCAPSQAMCQEILDIAALGMDSTYEKASETIGGHTLTQLSAAITVIVDPQLRATQKQNIQIIEDETLLLEEKQEELKRWEQEVVPVAPYTVKSFVGKLVKFMLIGAGIGALLMAGVEAFRYAVSDRVLGVLEFQDRFDLNVLGELPGVRRPHSVVDRWADRIGGISLRMSDRDSLTAVAAENMIQAAKEAKSVALIGSVSTQELEQLAEALRNHAGSRLTVLAAGDPLRCASAAAVIRCADAVVLVESQGSSTYTDIRNMCQQMNIWEKPVLGIVFSGVDALDG